MNDIPNQYSDEAVEKGRTKNLEFIQSLGEARMFKTRQQIKGEGARSLTDHLFVSLLSLYAMSNSYDHAPTVKQYARRTTMYGGFNRPSPSGTHISDNVYTFKT